MFAVRTRLCLSLLVLALIVTACGENTGANGGPIVNADSAQDVPQLDDSTDQPPLDAVTQDGLGDTLAGSDAALDGLDAVPLDAFSPDADASPTDADVPAPDADATTPDADAVAPDADLVEVDAAPDVAPDVPPCTAAGCVCKTASECDSAVCLDDVGGKVCAATCTDTCPAGYGCVAVGANKVCKPAFSRLCEPCNQDADCVDSADSTGACVTYKNGASLIGNFCGGGKCDANTLCPTGFTCATVVSVDGFAMAQCIRDDKQCPCDTRAQTLNLSTTCSAANSDGTCGGKRNCSANGLSACSAITPSAETCDGVDNDCDGKTDNISCDDGNPCTADACDAASQACKHTPASAPCDDGSKCTTSDACVNGGCTGKLKNCDDGNECTDDSCDPKNGCVSTPATGPCGAADVCTIPGQCSDSACVGAKAKNCDDSNPCTVDACDPTSGCIHKSTTAACNDGDPCTTSDNCTTGVCQGTPKNCNDNNVCTDDSCDASGCHNTPTGGPCDDGNACTSSDTCTDGACAGKGKNCNDGNSCTNDGCDLAKGCSNVLVVGAGCDDGNPCSTGEKCDSSGVCQAGIAVVCDDGNPCTADACDGVTGVCKYSNLTGACDDGIACTVSDTCAGGACAGTAKKCSDGNPCTIDQCDNLKGCTYTAVVGASCDDGNLCTTGDKCDGNGSCQAGAVVSCDDLNPCTADVCDLTSGLCKNTSISSACDDGNACTNKDFCAAGACLGTAISCDDNNACTSDSCDKTKGCVHTNLTSSCSDNNPCTAGDKCDGAGNCLAGAVVSCDDLNPCTADVCDLASGACKNTNISSACDDVNACTNKDVCAAGICAGTAISCDDNNACTSDSCDKVKGCQHANLTGGCSDNNPCTVGEACSAGVCQGGTAAPCDDANVCTTDACDSVLGCTHTGNNISCSDGNPCTTGDACNSTTGKCVSGSNTCDCTVQADCDAKPNLTPCAGKLVCDTSAVPYKCVISAATKIVCDTSKDTLCSATACDNTTGTCKSSPINASGPCTDGSACTVSDTCLSGICIPGAAPNCNDGLLCTTDSCDPGTGCKHVNNTLGCDDGDACTQNDTCGGGTCKGTAVVGCCTSTAQCDDSNPCTIDSCDAVGGKCTHDAAAATGLACNADSSGCTQNDMCVAGACIAGPPPDCSGLSDTCNLGVCAPTSPSTFICLKSAKTNGTSCDDGLYCNTGETCKAGVCQGGATLDCSSAGCTQGSCDEVQKKCIGTPKADTTPCDADNNGCTINDVCKSGTCTAGPAFVCAQQVATPCLTYACASTGAASYQCLSSPKTQGTSCDDGLYCTISDACDAVGACKGGGARDCSAFNAQCTTGTCDETNKLCKATSKADNTACNDGDSCTATDTCKTGVCVGSSNSCGDFKVTTFKTASTGNNPGSSLVDMGSGRMRATFANSATAIAGRSYRSDWSREWTEAALATASAASGNQETLVGGPILVPSASGGHDLYWASDYSANQAVWYYNAGGLNACSGSVYSSSGYGNVVYASYAACSPYAGSSCIQATRAAGARHVSYQHFDTLDAPSGGIVDVYAVNTGCTTATQYPITAFTVAPYSDGKRFVAWMQNGTLTKKIINSNATLYKDLGTDATVKNFDAAVYQGDNTSILVWDDGAEIWAQLYYSNGNTNGSKFQVNTNVTGVQAFPRVAYEPATGIFIVAWNTDVNAGDLQAQMFLADSSKAGTEFTVNTTTTGFQGNARLASHADGNFVIAFEDSSGKDGAGYGILGQWFDAGGNKVGAEKVIDVTTAGDQKYIAALGLSTGDVVLSWTNMSDGTVYARKFNSSGLAQNGAQEFIANTTKTDEQQHPAVTVAGDGSFVVAWDSYLTDGSQEGVYFQRYSSSGVVVGTETLANTTTANKQFAPSVAADSVGNFVAVWDSFGQDGSLDGVFAQRFNNAGAKAGSEFAMNQYTTFDQANPSVASLSTGKFAAVWESNGQPGGAAYDVVMRCYDSNGTALTNELIVNTTTTEKQRYPAIAAFADGTQHYIVVWQSYGEDSDGWGIYAQIMTYDCTLVGTPWKVNTTVVGDQQTPKVAVDPTGKYVISWSSMNQDGDNFGIYAQAYDNTGAKIGTETKLNAVTALEQSHSGVAMLSGGKFVAVWQTLGEDESGSAGWALKGAQFGLTTLIAQTGLDWLFNTTFSNDQTQPVIAARPDGSIITVWRSNLQDGYVGTIVGRIQTP